MPTSKTDTTRIGLSPAVLTRQVGNCYLAISGASPPIPPTLNCTNPIPELGNLQVVTSAAKPHPQGVLNFAMGFGGFYFTAAHFAGSRLANRMQRWRGCPNVEEALAQGKRLRATRSAA